MFGITDAQLRKHLRRLQDEEGFPMEAPFQKRPMLFPRIAVERWLCTIETLTADVIEAAEATGRSTADIHVFNLARRRPDAS
jgi:hypothetical protein